MAEALVSVALETLRDLLLEEFRFLSGVSSEVKGLQTQLKEIKCLLKDADRRQHESESVLNWIAEIRDLAFRSEDAIETYAVQISSKRGPGFKKLLDRFSCVLNEGHSLHQIGSEISNIKSEIARVSRSMQAYGIRNIIEGESSTASPNNNQYWKRQTFPFEIEDCFVGKDDELKRLVSLAVDVRQHRIISVWGMGGIGKTTIARKVYNHIETKHSFECFAWVCITQQFQIRSVLEEVVKQLIPHKRQDISCLSNRELIGQLCQIQKDKRCFVVLDDLWEIDHWDGLKHAFLIEGLKSKVLITTRKRSVADVGSAFELGLLHIADGWELLKKKAFPRNNIPDFPVEEKALQEIGKEMVRKCGCLPLVISLLGGVLSKKTSMEEWESVNENINAYIFRGEGIEKNKIFRGEGIEKNKEIHGILDLSYEDLPYYLKPCFLYMGQFREDQTIVAVTLYRMWIAAGMILHENQGNEETLMDIAELYLSELASRCIVQVEFEDVVKAEKYRSCKLHDVVRELCLSKGNKEDFCCKDIDYQGGKFSALLDQSMSGFRTRALAIHFERGVEVECDGFTITQLDNSRHVRSLQFINYSQEATIEFPQSIVDFRKFKLLRVLVFERFNFSGGKIPRAIGNLIHLRYLRLRICKLDELPASISNLTYLYTLDLVNSWNVLVPNILKKMRRLKHLLLPGYDIEKVGNYQLELEGLDELETLYGFNSLAHDLKALSRMKNLRRLEAVVYDNESLSTIINAIITNLKRLRYCTLVINYGCQFTSMDDGSSFLKKVFICPNLHALGIHVYVGKLLKECGNQITMSRLVRLYFVRSELEDDPMEILAGKLPFLEHLRLLELSFLGQEMRCRAWGFPRLKYLEIYFLPNLRMWSVEPGAMPVLSEIKINGCLLLKMVPYGLRFIDTLQKLTIIAMPELGKRVSASTDNRREGEDFDKVRHVPSIVIIDNE